MKHLHTLLAVVIIGLFVYQSYLVLAGNKQAPRLIKISTHILYALIILSGMSMLMILMSAQVPVQWVLAKVILLIAAISASMKAFKPNADATQSKAGMFIAAVAYIGIVILAFAKPANLF